MSSGSGMKRLVPLLALRLFLSFGAISCAVVPVHAVSATAPPLADTPRPPASQTAPAADASRSGEPWSRYFAKGDPTLHRGGPGLPGRIFGEETAEGIGERLRVFSWTWRYRPVTYELHYANSRDLARAAYGLALHSGDIEPRMTLSRLSSVAQSHHYSMTQVCAWLNDAFAGRFKALSQEELVLVGFLVQDGALRVENGRFVPAGLITHILAAAPGKRRSFAESLEHERLHVFWNQSVLFRNAAEQRWKALSESESARVREELAPYAADEARLIEEWAVREAETGRLSPEEAERQ